MWKAKVGKLIAVRKVNIKWVSSSNCVVGCIPWLVCQTLNFSSKFAMNSVYTLR